MTYSHNSNDRASSRPRLPCEPTEPSDTASIVEAGDEAALPGGFHGFRGVVGSDVCDSFGRGDAVEDGEAGEGGAGAAVAAVAGELDAFGLGSGPGGAELRGEIGLVAGEAEVRPADPLGFPVDGGRFLAEEVQREVGRRAFGKRPGESAAADKAAGRQAQHAGDNGPATAASLNFPTDVAVGPDHSIYISDAHNHVIRRVSPQGIITTVAGTPGQRGFSGDGGPATAARFNLPSGISVDGSGNLYVADVLNNRIRLVRAQ